MDQRPTHILYLHGFNSSPRSFKAQALLSHMQQRGLGSNITVADVPPKPGEAAPYLETEASSLLQHTQLAVVGSSLGGFYSTWLAEKFDLRAVLINPAVRPHERLHEYLGENRNYHTGDRWTFTRADLDTLQAMALDNITQPGRYRVLLQTGDETLDYRQAERYYAGTDIVIEEGGDHAFQGFEDHIPGILRFCAVDEPAG